MLRTFTVVWLSYWLVVLALPVSRPEGMLETFALQGLFVIPMAGSIALGMRQLKTTGTKRRPSPPIMPAQRNALSAEGLAHTRKRFIGKINILSLVVVIAPILLIIDKVVLDGLDYSQGLTRIRAEQIGSENSTSIFSIMGYVALSQVTVLTYLILTHSDLLSKKRLFFSFFVSLIAIVIFSILIGGRSPLFVFLTAVLAIFLINFSINIKHVLWISIVGLTALLFSGYIFLDRIDSSGTAPGIYTSIFMHWLNLRPDISVGNMSQFPAIITLIGSYFAHSFYVANDIIASSSYFNEGQSVFTFPTQLMSRLGIVEEPAKWAYAGIFSSITGQLYYQFGLSGYLASVAIYCLIIYFCFYLIRRTRRGAMLNYLSYMLISSVILTPMVLPIDFVFFPFAFIFGGAALLFMRLRF